MNRLLESLLRFLESSVTRQSKKPEVVEAEVQSSEKPMPYDEDRGPSLPVIVLERFKFTTTGTLGRLLYESGEPFHDLVTIELPWRENARQISCIPRGEYKVTKTRSPRFGDCYLVNDVPGRSHILFHHGNFAGKSDLGARTDSNGCILLGYKHGVLQGQNAVLSSRLARTFFETTLDFEPFKLVITEKF